MKSLLRKAYAFVQRDFRIESGYKISFLSRIFDSVVLIAFFFFLNKLIASRGTTFLSAYGGQYFPFAIIGLACARYFDLTQRMFSESVRLAQVTGCLDAMLSSQTGGVTIALMSSLYGLISGSRAVDCHLCRRSSDLRPRPQSHERVGNTIGLVCFHCHFCSFRNPLGGNCCLAEEG